MKKLKTPREKKSGVMTYALAGREKSLRSVAVNSMPILKDKPTLKDIQEYVKELEKERNFSKV
jgi:hypothetical protein